MPDVDVKVETVKKEDEEAAGNDVKLMKGKYEVEDTESGCESESALSGVEIDPYM